jgi:hypothetical protein
MATQAHRPPPLSIEEKSELTWRARDTEAAKRRKSRNFTDRDIVPPSESTRLRDLRLLGETEDED